MSLPAGGSSVDDDPVVQVSSFCSGGDCVGVARRADGVRIVDTKTGEALQFTSAEFDAFLAGVHAGEFDAAPTDRSAP